MSATEILIQGPYSARGIGKMKYHNDMFAGMNTITPGNCLEISNFLALVFTFKGANPAPRNADSVRENHVRRLFRHLSYKALIVRAMTISIVELFFCGFDHNNPPLERMDTAAARYSIVVMGL